MKAAEMLMVCMACRRVREYQQDWREPTPADSDHPARSHGYCSDDCARKHYPNYKGGPV